MVQRTTEISDLEDCDRSEPKGTRIIQEAHIGSITNNRFLRRDFIRNVLTIGLNSITTIGKGISKTNVNGREAFLLLWVSNFEC